MNSRLLHHRLLLVSWAVLPILTLLTTPAFLAAQATLSAGPLLLYQVRTIYVAPSADDFGLLVKERLEKWSAVEITSKLEEADAILTCQTERTIVPAKVVVPRTIAEVTLVDRRSQKPIWRTSKYVAFDRTLLVDGVMEQLKRDWRQSAMEY